MLFQRVKSLSREERELLDIGVNGVDSACKKIKNQLEAMNRLLKKNTNLNLASESIKKKLHRTQIREFHKEVMRFIKDDETKGDRSSHITFTTH